jgi:hypothetical protein
MVFERDRRFQADSLASFDGNSRAVATGSRRSPLGLDVVVHIRRIDDLCGRSVSSGPDEELCLLTSADGTCHSNLPFG